MHVCSAAPSHTHIVHPRSPDKHPDNPKAADRFKRLGLINKILRDERRDRYDHFLSKGFPRWRSQEGGASGFYYQRWRPSLLLVISIIVLFTSGVQLLAQKISFTRNTERLATLTENAQLAAWGPAFRTKPDAARPERKVRIALRAPPLPPKADDAEEDERTLRRLLASGTGEGQRVELKVSSVAPGLWVSDGEGGWESLGPETLEVPSVQTLWPARLFRRLTGGSAGAAAADVAASVEQSVTPASKKGAKKAQ